MHEYKTSGKEERMEKNDQKNRQKSDYEAPKIKEEIVLEQKALACGGMKNGGGGQGGGGQGGMLMMS